MDTTIIIITVDIIVIITVDIIIIIIIIPIVIIFIIITIVPLTLYGVCVEICDTRLGTNGGTGYGYEGDD